MSPLQILHTACAAIYLCVAGYVLWRAPRHQRNLAFVGITMCFAWWSGSLVFAHSPGVPRSVAETAYNVGAVAWSSFSSFAIWFALAFSGHTRRLRSMWARLCLVLPPALVTVQQWRGLVAEDYTLQPWGWAYVWTPSPWSLFFYTYYGAYMAVALWLVWRVAQSTTHPLQRRQAKIILYTAVVPLVLSTLSDVILPWLRLHSFPNIAPTFFLAWSVGTAFAIDRYRLLDLSFELAASDILESMTESLLLLDASGRVIGSNSAAIHLFGRTGAELKRCSLADLLLEIPSGEGSLTTLLRSSEYANGNPPEPRAPPAVSVDRALIRDPAGYPLGSFCLVRDVTTELHAKRQLEETHALLELRVQQRTQELLRSSRSLEALRDCTNAIHKTQDLEKMVESVAHHLSSGFEPARIMGCRIVLAEKAFTSTDFVESEHVISAPIRTANRQLGVVEAHLSQNTVEAQHDELRLLESVAAELGVAIEGVGAQQALIQSERLASVGLLAAGVAHEINNPLTYVIENLRDIRRSLRPDDDAKVNDLCQQATEALEGCERITRIVAEMSSFARVGNERSLVHIAEPVDAAIAMAKNEIRHRAQLICHHLPTNLVVADSGRLAQVCLNLLMNAAHAIPAGSAANHQIAVKTFQRGNSVVLEVRDTGSGISEDALPKLFDPFYSTKQKGKGTGLGLSICREIVSEVGGEIFVASTVGKGSCFRVELPGCGTGTHQPRPKRSERLPKSSLPSRRSSGRILIIDDEPAVASALRRILRDHDCRISSSGKAAQATLKQDGEFDLIFCDLMMPDLSGADFHAWLETANPQLAQRMYFITGGAFTDQTLELLESVPERVLPKPFDGHRVRQLVEEILAGN